MRGAGADPEADIIKATEEPDAGPTALPEEIAPEFKPDDEGPDGNGEPDAPDHVERLPGKIPSESTRGLASQTTSRNPSRWPV